MIYGENSAEDTFITICAASENDGGMEISMDNFEEKLKKIADSQIFAPEDELTEIIEESLESDELNENDLYWVTAARTSDFDKFRKFCEKKKK